MKQFVTALAAVLMALGAVTSSAAVAQSNDDVTALSKCVGYEACKAIQDKIDAIRNGANKVVNTVSNAVSPNDDRSYFEKFSLEERQEAMATCQKNYAGRNCEVSYLTPEEIAARHPQAKAPAPLSPEVARTREREQLGRFDKSVADVLDLKCFTPLMANGQNYGDCADALTQLNRLEKDAKTLGLPLRASALAQQYGFPRNPDGTWNDRYARVGEPPKQASAQAEPAAAPTATNANHASPDYTALLAKCPQILGCSTKDLEMIVQGSDALRQEACGPAACTYENFKLMSQVEKELIAKGNRARAELASRRPPQNALASNWLYVGKSSLARHYLDTDSLSRDGNTVILWTRAQYFPRESATESNESLTHLRANCVDHSYSVIEMQVLTASQVTASDGAQPMDYAHVGGPMYQVIAAACARRNVAKLPPLARGTAPQSATNSSTAAVNLNGEWVGQSSGNRVRQELRSDGLYVTAVGQGGTAQAETGFLFRADGHGGYRYQFPGGQYATVVILGPGKYRTTNPDGWTDVFVRVGP